MSGYSGASLKTTGGPKFAMVGIDKPDGGCLLYASRDLPQDKLLWGVANDRYGTATGWHVDAEMRNVLIIDKRTWGECFARLFEIWGNWDRNEALEAAQQANREHALEAAGKQRLPVAVQASYHYAANGHQHAGLQVACRLCYPPSPATARALAEGGTETLEDPPGMGVILSPVRLSVDTADANEKLEGLRGAGGEKAPERRSIRDVRQVAIIEGRLTELRSAAEQEADRPWAAPDADVAGDLREAKRRAEQGEDG